MSNDLNQCQFIGRLGKNPESRAMPNGDDVSSFSIAVGWKGKDSEGAEWVNIVVFGKLAEICNKYLQKGSQVFIQGRMKTRKYTDKTGVEKYSTEVIADRMQMLGGKSEQRQSPTNDAAENVDADIPF